MPPHRLLLQAAEATKLLTEATGNVSKQAAAQGETATVYWWLALLFLIAAVILAILLYKSEKGKAAEIQAARAKWAEEMAVNNGVNVALQDQMRKQYEQQIQQLRDEKKDLNQQILENNKELRAQVSKDAQVLEATSNSLRAIAKTATANNANTIEILRGLAALTPGIQRGITPDIL